MSLGDNFPPLESFAAGGRGLRNRNVTGHQYSTKADLNLNLSHFVEPAWKSNRWPLQSSSRSFTMPLPPESLKSRCHDVHGSSKVMDAEKRLDAVERRWKIRSSG